MNNRRGQQNGGWVYSVKHRLLLRGFNSNPQFPVYLPYTVLTIIQKEAYSHATVMSSEGIFSVLGDLWASYRDDTPKKLKLVDAYLAYIMATGIIQFLYCCLVGTFPFNSFLSGFISTVASFVLGGKGFYLLYNKVLVRLL